MRQHKYKVSIPKPNSDPVEYEERLFYEKVNVCEFLEIKPNTFTRICENKLYYKHKSVQRLFGIKIEKIKTIRPKKVTEDMIKEESNNFINKLLEKETGQVIP